MSGVRNGVTVCKQTVLKSNENMAENRQNGKEKVSFGEKKGRKEGNILSNDALVTFYFTVI